MMTHVQDDENLFAADHLYIYGRRAQIHTEKPVEIFQH